MIALENGNGKGNELQDHLFRLRQKLTITYKSVHDNPQHCGGGGLVA